MEKAVQRRKKQPRGEKIARREKVETFEIGRKKKEEK